MISINRVVWDEKKKQGLKSHMLMIYAWMIFGCFVTVGVAGLMVYTNSLDVMLPLALISVAILLLIPVLFIKKLKSFSKGTLLVLYIAYAILYGILLSYTFYISETSTIVIGFGFSILYFVSLCIIGCTTKYNLDKMGTLCTIGLVPIILYMIYGFIFRIDVLSIALSILILVLFIGITAWDAQKIRLLYNQYYDDEVMKEKMVIYSAFNLYIDFLNIFVHMLNILNKK